MTGYAVYYAAGFVFTHVNNTEVNQVSPRPARHHQAMGLACQANALSMQLLCQQRDLNLLASLRPLRGFSEQ